MEKISIGYVQGVHGLRGDLKIKNRFDKPEKVFIKGQTIMLNEEPHTISACKFYKGFYLVTIDNIKDINKVEHYIGYDVFIERDNLKLKENEYINQDLYGMDIVCDNKNYGKVREILNNGVYDILQIDYTKSYMIPLVKEYVVKVDIKNKAIECKDIEGLIL